MPNHNPHSDSDRFAQETIIVIRQFLQEAGSTRAQLAVSLQGMLDRDLGIGSLEKAEILHRLEKKFAIHLPDVVLAEAETVQDLVTAVQQAKPAISFMHRDHTKATAPPLAALELDLTKLTTLTEVLIGYAEREPERPHISLVDDQGEVQSITYGELLHHAQQVARGLIEQGLKAGETVAIMLPTCADFFSIFFGILFMGAIPVPIYPPFRAAQIQEYAKREATILRNAEVRLLITFAEAEGVSHILKGLIPSLRTVMTVSALRQSAPPPLQQDINSLQQAWEVEIAAQDAALIQYTSGSTGNPKGVLLTHANLLANIRAFGSAIKISPQDVVVSWLPLYHDMGLIGAWLGSLYYGLPLVVLSPLTFLNHPERWLWTIHSYRATLSAAPNFAYEMCLQKIDEKNLVGLDLSCWRIAINGAEAIYPKTLRRFAEKFARYGFKEESIFPVYGLAESAVAVSFPPLGRKPLIDQIAREPFAKERQAIPFAADQKKSLEFVCCGQAIPGHALRIVDEKGEVLPERMIGNVQFTGPSSMQGYYRNPTATAAIYHDGWWDTGDLGYLAEGELYLTGRHKDMIIRAGRNIYPIEIEEIAEQVTGVRKGCVVALGVHDPQLGTEKLIIIAETREQTAAVQAKISSTILEKITTLIDVPPDEVILVPSHTIPKTSSGKLRRADSLRLYQTGKLTKPKTPVWLQFGQLVFRVYSQKFMRLGSQAIKFIYTTYAYLLAGFIFGVLWLSSWFLSVPTFGKFCRISARIILKGWGCRWGVHGRKKIPQQEGGILVANHSSYVDILIMLAVLPSGSIFMAKRELGDTPFLRRFIRKMQVVLVERLDFAQSIKDAATMTQILQQKKMIVIFPEGTFTYATGLRPFKLGAFKIAVEDQVPIFPVAIQGTRSILRSNTYLLKPGKINVYFGQAIKPKNQEWSEVIRLRDAARHFIAAYCGEPTLDLIRAGVEPPTR